MALFTREDIDHVDDSIHPDELENPPWEDYGAAMDDTTINGMAEAIGVGETDDLSDGVRESQNRRAWFNDQDVATTLLVASPRVTAVEIFEREDLPTGEGVRVDTDFKVTEGTVENESAEIFETDRWRELSGAVSRHTPYHINGKLVIDGNLVLVLINAGAELKAEAEMMSKEDLFDSRD